MALIRLHRNPLGGVDAVETYSGELMEYIMRHEWCRDGLVVAVNGVKVADSGTMSAEELVVALSVDVGADDTVDVYARPNAASIGIGWLIAIAVGVTVAAVALMPKPKIPGDMGENDTSQNNQLNAAQNSFRPNEAIPDISGRVIAYPDFIQRSSYTYIQGRRVFSELMCLGVGAYEIHDSYDGESSFSSLNNSTITVYEPFEPVPDDLLIDVRTAEGSEDLPLEAQGSPSTVGQIINGQISASGTISVGQAVIDDLGLSVGDDVLVSGVYLNGGDEFPYTETHEIIDISGGVITVTPAPTETSDLGSFQGTIQRKGASVKPQWFTLPGRNITQARFQITMPQGIRKADGSALTVSVSCVVEKLDENGDPTGVVTSRTEVFSGATLQQQFRTVVIDLEEGRYRALVNKASVTAPDDIGLVRCERIESVTKYSVPNFGDATIIHVQRATSAQQGRGASNKISVDCTRKLPIFNSDTATFGALATTRAAEQYVMYLLNKANVPLSLINHTELFAATNGLGELGYFDFSYDSYNVSLRERVVTALNVARCYHYMQGSIWRFGRDEAKPVRKFVINRRNLVPQTYNEAVELVVTNDYDSVEVEYVDPDTNTKAYIKRRVTAAGVIEEGLGLRADKIKLAGCRTYEQARNRAEMEIRRLARGARIVSCQVLPDILAVEVGSRGGVVNPASSTYVSGEVLDQDGTTLTLSEPVSSDGYIYLVEADGTVTNAVAYTRIDDYNVTAAGLAASIANGYDVQMGSKFVAAIGNDFAYTDFILRSRGRPDDNWHVPVELISYDESDFDGDEPPPPPPVPDPELVISAHGGTVTISNSLCVNANAVATVTASGGDGTYTYAWTKISGEGSIVSGASASSATVRFSTVCPEESKWGVYRCTVTSGAQTKSVNVTFQAENIAADPNLKARISGALAEISSPICDTATVTGTAVASGGTGSYTYAWSKVSGSGTITSGTTSASLSVQFTSVCAGTGASGVYKCIVSDGAQSVTVSAEFSVSNTYGDY